MPPNAAVRVVNCPKNFFKIEVVQCLFGKKLRRFYIFIQRNQLEALTKIPENEPFVTFNLLKLSDS